MGKPEDEQNQVARDRDIDYAVTAVKKAIAEKFKDAPLDGLTIVAGEVESRGGAVV